jgi:hypothetical protein
VATTGEKREPWRVPQWMRREAPVRAQERSGGYEGGSYGYGYLMGLDGMLYTLWNLARSVRIMTLKPLDPVGVAKIACVDDFDVAVLSMLYPAMSFAGVIELVTWF